MADVVWSALGNPAHYIEPFFGSGAVLLARPNYNQSMTETINDKDGFVCNVWRALKFAPDEVAKWCDWPVNHIDLNARRRELIKNEEMLVKNLTENTEWFDAKLAGFWVWAASCWIGGGLTRPNAMPHITSKEQGINTIGQIPHIGHKGKGINVNNNIYEWFEALSHRLRRVRVVCGEWNRVCGGNWQDKLGDVGIFFDPPYGVEDRDTRVYHHDTTTIAKDVMAWCLERGEKPSYRIVLAGYEEYDELLKHGWASLRWRATGGYGNLGNGRGKENRHRETLYFSPHCVKRTLF